MPSRVDSHNTLRLVLGRALVIFKQGRMMMTQAEQARLDSICADAFARLDAMDERLWLRGFIGKPQNQWGKVAVPMAKGETEPRSGPKPTAPVLKPVPGPIKGPGTTADLATISAQIKALARA